MLKYSSLQKSIVMALNLMSLAPKIRLKIYGYVFGDACRKLALCSGDDHVTLEPGSQKAIQRPALLLTCRKIQDEARTVLYEKTFFWLKTHVVCEWFLCGFPRLPDGNFQMIQYLLIDIILLIDIVKGSQTPPCFDSLSLVASFFSGKHCALKQLTLDLSRREILDPAVEYERLFALHQTQNIPGFLAAFEPSHSIYVRMKDFKKCAKIHFEPLIQAVATMKGWELEDEQWLHSKWVAAAEGRTFKRGTWFWNIHPKGKKLPLTTADIDDICKK